MRVTAYNSASVAISKMRTFRWTLVEINFSFGGYKMVLKDLTDLYCWVRKNNQHTPDDVLDFMYNASVEKFTSTNNERIANCALHEERMKCPYGYANRCGDVPCRMLIAQSASIS